MSTEPSSRGRAIWSGSGLAIFSVEPIAVGVKVFLSGDRVLRPGGEMTCARKLAGAGCE